MANYPDITVVPSGDLQRDKIFINNVLSGKVNVYGEALLDDFEEALLQLENEQFARRMKKNST